MRRGSRGLLMRHSIELVPGEVEEELGCLKRAARPCFLFFNVEVEDEWKASRTLSFFAG